MTFGKNSAIHSFEGPEVPVYSRIAILSTIPIFSSQMGAKVLYITSQLQLLGIIFCPTVIDLKREGFATAEVKNFLGKIPVFYDFEESPESLKIIFVLLFIFGVYEVLSIILLGYYFKKLKQKEMMHPFLMRLWYIVGICQNFLFCFTIHILSLKFLSSLVQDKISDKSVMKNKNVYIVVCIVILVVNFAFSLTIGILFSIKVKIKYTFSMKTKAIDILDFAYKTLAPLTWIFQDYSDVYSSILLFISLIYCLIRNLMFFRLLPFYKIRILKWEVICQALLTSFAFSALIAKPISIERSYIELRLLVLIWVISGFAFLKLYFQILNSLFLRILIIPEQVNSYQLIHYYAIYQYFARHIPLSKAQRYRMNEKYLHYSSIIWNTGDVGSSKINLAEIMDSSNEEERAKKLDHHFLKITLQLWEERLRNDHSGLLKVMLAYYYTTKREQYLLANHILEKNSTMSSFTLETSFSLVRLRIYNKLKHDRSEGEEDLRRSLEIQNTYRRTKLDIIKTLETEIKFWSVFQTHAPDFITLLDQAEQVEKLDQSITQKTNHHHQAFLEAGFSSPLLVYSLYFSFVKHDITQGQRYIRLYCNKVSQQNVAIAFGNNEIKEWRDFVFVISASYEKLGRILDCSGHIGEFLPVEKEKLIGKSFHSLLPHVYSQPFDNLMKTLYKDLNSKFLDNKIMIPIEIDDASSAGCIKFCWLYLTLVYLPEYGFCFHALLSPIKSTKERIVIVAPNGSILNFSKEFLEDMSMLKRDSTSMNIYELCPDFERFLSLSSTSAPLRKKLNRSRIKTLENPSATLVSSWLLQSERPSSPEGKSKEDFFFFRDTEKEKDIRGMKSMKLTFYPNFSSPMDLKSPKAKEESTSVDYQVEIFERNLQNTKFFELRMKRIKDEKEISPKKNSHTFIKFPSEKDKENPTFPQIAHTQTLFTMMSNVSPLKPTLKNSPGRNPSPSRGVSFFNFMKTMQSTEEIKLTTTVENDDHHRNKPKLKIIHEPSFDSGIGEDTPRGTPKGMALMSPMSENRKLMLPTTTNGDFEDVYQSQSRSRRDGSKLIMGPSSSKMDCEAGGDKGNDFVDTKRLEMNLIGEILGDENQEQDDDDISSVILFKKKVEAHRRLKRILQSRKYQSSAFYYSLCFMFTQASLFVFLVWLNYDVASISKNAEDMNKVITDFYARSFHTELLNQDIMMLLALRSSADLSQYMAWGVDASTTDIYNLKRTNGELANSLSLMEDKVQKDFYEPNIRMYERNTYGELEYIGTDNLFQAVQKIMENGFANMARADFAVPGEFFINENMLFILDNSMNDLLIIGETIISRLEKRLYDYFDTSKVSLAISLVIILTILVLFMFATLAIVLIIKKDTGEFMQKMFILPFETTARIERKLILFKEALERDSHESDFLSIFRLGRRHSKGKNKASHDTRGNKKRAMRYMNSGILKRFSRKNLLLFLLLLLCLALTVGIVMIYYSQALRRVTVMKKQQTNTNYALNYINFLGQFMPALEISVLLNATTDFRNMPVLEGLRSQLQRFKKFDEIQESLKDAYGEYSEVQKEILFGYDCHKIYTPLYPWPEELMLLECDFASGGLGRISLAKTLTALETILEQFLVEFELVRGDMEAMLKFYGDFVIQVISYHIDMGFLLLIRSFVASSKDFSDLSKSLEQQRIVLGWVALLISIALGATTWIFVVRKLLRREFERKKILALVPTRIIFGNFLLKNYVKRLSCHPNDQLTNLGEII